MNDGNTKAVKERHSFTGIASLLLIVLLWLATFWQGLVTAVDIWLITDTFNHCLFVIPASIYFIYLKREQLALSAIEPNYWVLIPCIGSAGIYAVGLSGGVQLFMHIATFTFLPLSVWFLLGNTQAKKILFPLFFILFCIPIGEELIPVLQEVTADLSVMMLQWIQVPIYRSGLYIEIPEGRFLVAEACSGISFFIASIVIGCLYAYMNMQSRIRRISFVIIAIIFPIIANAIRVFGIILTGHLTNMEHAVGADHLIYGWVFFSLVIICLIGLGELIREKSSDIVADPKFVPTEQTPLTGYVKACGVLALLTIVLFIWYQVIQGQLSATTTPRKLNASILPAKPASKAWQPEFVDYYDQYQTNFSYESKKIDLSVVWYPKGHGELVSYANRMYLEDFWTLESSYSVNGPNDFKIEINQIVNSRNVRLLGYWYMVDGKVLSNKNTAKLYEIYKVMLGQHKGSGLVMLSMESEYSALEKDKRLFLDMLTKEFSTINQMFPE